MTSTTKPSSRRKSSTYPLAISRRDSRLVLVTAVAAFSLGGCGKKKSASDPDAALVVNSDAAELASRLDTTSVPVTLDTVSGGGSTSLALGPNLDLLGLFAAVQVGVLTPPTVASQVMQADSVFVDSGAAYVSYNLAGNASAGAIDQVNVAVAALPLMVANISSAANEYNGLTKAGSTLYVVGDNPSATPEAFLQSIAITGNVLSTTTTQVNLPSYAGTDVASGTAGIYVTSGDTGGLTVFNPASLAQTSYTAVSDARSVRVSAVDGSVTVLSGQPGTATKFSPAGVQQTTYALGGAATPDSKSTLQIGSLWTAASLGEAGFKLYCNSTGAVMASVPAVTVSGIVAAKTVTNAVAGANGLIFTANGEAGVYVYELKQAANGTACGTATVSLLGSLNFGASLSANSVYFAGGVLYVVTGLGGLRMVTVVYTPQLGDSTNFN